MKDLFSYSFCAIQQNNFLESEVFGQDAHGLDSNALRNIPLVAANDHWRLFVVSSLCMGVFKREDLICHLLLE